MFVAITPRKMTSAIITASTPRTGSVGTRPTPENQT